MEASSQASKQKQGNGTSAPGGRRGIARLYRRAKNESRSLQNVRSVYGRLSISDTVNVEVNETPAFPTFEIFGLYSGEPVLQLPVDSAACVVPRKSLPACNDHSSPILWKHR